MLKFSVVVLVVSAIYYTQCLPTQTSHSDSQSETSDKLNLFVNNGSQSTDYHLTSAVAELENEDQVLNAQLNAVLPYLNFLVRMIDVLTSGEEEQFEGSSNSI